jgi:hypothetical protein
MKQFTRLLPSGFAASTRREGEKRSTLKTPRFQPLPDADLPGAAWLVVRKQKNILTSGPSTSFR